MNFVFWFSILRENSPMNAELGIAPHAESTAGTEAEPKPKDALCSEVLFRRPLATENSQLNTKSSGSIRLDSKSSSLALNEVRNQKPSVKTQATNTATTTTGLPPLEGIHAGVGFGLESKFRTDPQAIAIPLPWFHAPINLFIESDHYLLPTSFSLQELYDRMGAEGESKERSDRLQVPSFIFFERSSGKRRAFCGKISITNTSEYFMSFCVRSITVEINHSGIAFEYIFVFRSRHPSQSCLRYSRPLEWYCLFSLKTYALERVPSMISYLKTFPEKFSKYLARPYIPVVKWKHRN